MAASSDTVRRIRRYGNQFRAKRTAEAAAGRLARIPFALARPLARRRPIRSDRVLVVERILRIGDTLVARPALAAIRHKHEGADVVVVCRRELGPLCRADNLVDHVIEALPGRQGFRETARAARAFGAAVAYVLVPDRWSPYMAWLAGAHQIIGYDYAGRGVALSDRREPPPRANVPAFLYPADSENTHAADIWLQLVADADARATSYSPFEPGRAARARVGRFLHEVSLAAARPLVVLHPGAAEPSYRWPETRWAALARALRGAGVAAFVLSGGPGERPAATAIAEEIGPGAAVAAGRLSLLETFALVAAADAVVSGDTAPVHIAATMGTPVVALYGPGDAEMWGPLGVPSRAIVGDALCRGCKSARCFQETHYCMAAITPAEVAEAVGELLAEAGA